MLNQKFLKTLLTTASAMAIVSGVATSASAATSHVLGPGAQVDQNKGGGGGTLNVFPVPDGVSALIFDDAYDLTSSITGNTSYTNVNTANGNGLFKTAAAPHVTTVNTVAGGAGMINVELGVGSTLVFTGPDLSKLGTIDGAAFGGTVIFDAAVTDGQVGVIGGVKYVSTVEINGANSTFANAITANTINDAVGGITFNGVIIANNLNTKNGATFGNGVTANNFATDANANTAINNTFVVGNQINNNGTITLGNTGELTIDGAIGAGGDITGAAVGVGKIVFNSLVDNNVGVIGAVRVGEVDVNFAGDNKFNKAITTSVFTLNAGVNAIITDVLTATTGVHFAGDGVLDLTKAFAGGSEITTANNNQGGVIFKAEQIAGSVGDIGAAGHALNTVVVLNAGNNVFSNINTGEFHLIGAGGAEITGVLTATTGVHFDGDGYLSLTNAFAGGGTITTVTNNQGTVVFNAVQLAGSVGDIGAAGKALKAVAVRGAGNNVFSNISTGEFYLNGASKVGITGVLTATTGVYFANDGVLDLTKAFAGGGKIITDHNGEGSVVFNAVQIAGSVGDIGAAGNALKAVVVNGAGNNVFSNINTGDFVFGAGVGAKITGVLTATTGVHFAGDGGLDLTNAFAGGGTITTANNNEGSVVFNAVQIAGSVGDIGAAGKALRGVEVNGAGDNVFSNINTREFYLGVGSNAEITGVLTATAFVEFTGEATLDLTNAFVGGGEIITDNNGEGRVIFNAVQIAGSVGDIGAAGKALRGVEVNGAGDNVFSNINTETLFISDGANTTTDALATTDVSIGNATLTTNGVLVGDVSFSSADGGTLNVNAVGGTTGGIIATANAGVGTVVFDNQVLHGEVGAIGEVSALGAVTINGANSVFDSAISANTITVGAATTLDGAINSTTFNANANTTAGGTITTHALNIDAGATLTTADVLKVTNGGNGLVTFTGAGTGSLVLGAGAEIDAVKTATKNQGTLRFNIIPFGSPALVTLGQVGEENMAIGNVIAGSAGTFIFTDKVYTNKFTISHAGANVTTQDKLFIGTTLDFTENGTFTFDAAADIAAITSSVANRGIVTINSQINARDNASMKGLGTIGAAGNLVGTVNVNYAGTNTLSTGDAVYATNFNVGKGASLTTSDILNITNLTLATGANVTATKAANINVLTIGSGNFTSNEALTLGAASSFTDDGSLTILSTGSIAGNSAITTTGPSGSGSITFNQLVGVNNIGAIGTAVNPLKAVTVYAVGDNTFNSNIAAKTVTLGSKGANIVAGAGITASTVNFASDANLTITGASNIAAITTAINGAGSLVFNDAVVAFAGATGVGNIGAEGAALKEITLAAAGGNAGAIVIDGGYYGVADYTFSGNIYAGTINLDNADHIQLAIKQAVNSNIVLKNTNHAGHAIELSNGAVINGNITSVVNGQGVVLFDGNAFVNGNIGISGTNLASVYIHQNINATINGNVYTEEFHNKGTLTLVKDVLISSPVIAYNASTLSLNNKKLTTGGLVLNATDTMHINYGVNGGSSLLTLSNVNMVSAAPGTGLDQASIIKVDFASTPYIPAAGTQVNLIVASASGGDQVAKVKTYLSKQVQMPSIENNLFKLSSIQVSQNGSTVTAYATSSVRPIVDIINSGFGTVNSGNASTEAIWNRLLNALTNNSLGVTENSFMASLGSMHSSEKDSLFKRMTTISSMSSATSACINAASASISSHMSSVSYASGDDMRKMGAWSSVFGEKATQSARKGDSGFKSDAYGVTLGADSEISDSSILGLAGSFANADMKLKDQLAGGKTKAKTYIASLYGIHNVGSWAMQGALSVGNTKSTVTTVGTAKFNSTNYGAKATASYNKDLSGMILTPTIGLEYANYGKSKATETGTQRIIKIKSLDKVSAIVGAKIATEVSGFMQEAHAFMDYNLTGKAQSTSAGLGSDATVNIATPNAKPVRATFNLGTSVSSNSDNVEYSIGYDATVANKYVAHRGSIKVRLNF